MFGLSGCRSPESVYNSLKQDVDRGEFNSALGEVDAALGKYGSNDSKLGWRFRILKARILVSRSQGEAALSLLGPRIPSELASTEIPEQRRLLRGIAHRSVQQFAEAESDFAEAERLAAPLEPYYACQLLLARGALWVDQRKYESARVDYSLALTLTRRYSLPFLEADALNDLARLDTSQSRFDEALDLYFPALELARSIRSEGTAATILGNLGWSYFELGDFERSLDFYQRSAEASNKNGMAGYSAYWFSGAANSYMELREYAQAEDLARTTLKSAERLKNAQTTTECLNTLTEVMFRTNRLAEAKRYNQEALGIEQAGLDNFGTIDTQLWAGHLAAAEKRLDDADSLFLRVLADTNADAPARWQAEAGLAEVRDVEGKPLDAEKLYRQAIKIIEDARSSIHHDELRLSFLSTGIAVYGDYIDFLIRHGRPDDALTQADLSRARTLAEGLSSEQDNAPHLTSRVPTQQLARQLHSTLLVYWLAEKHSYLWAITPTKTVYFTLPPASEIDPLIKSYRELSLKSEDLLQNATAAGEKLYATLIEPARKLIAPGSRVILLPDTSLYGLNFETLIVPDPQPHYWIEDVTLTTASSLSMLASALNRAPPKNKNLLLLGDAVPVPEFGPLPQAALEIQKIQPYFPEKSRTVLTGAQATPSAYTSSQPGGFAYLHFVTHGTASRARPLESAVVLSKEPPSETYKLYARDIVTHPLHAELVTISACNGSGTRAYSGEGLVGLSWAFLRAGAHNVIGALWEVSDASTPQLMDKMYAELAAGKDPATALRDAKLSLLHSPNVFAKPFYWAPFQLYTGS